MMKVVYRTVVLALVALALIVVGFFFKPRLAKAAARSVRVIIKNDTDRNLTNVSVSIQHGIVTTNPPNSIPPSEVGELFAESQGVLTGTEGTVTYQVEGTNGTTSFHWDNPYAGSNSANGSAPAGFQVKQIGDTGNRTLVFFSIHSVNHPVASCNPDWVVGHLGTTAEVRLDGVDKAVGFLTTPFKRMGIGGWVDTGCEADAEGWPVRDAQLSTDGFWTIDVKLSRFTINGISMPSDQQRFVRIEVEPNTPAHQSAAAKENLFIRFNGRVVIDTHHGDELIEVHPWNPITRAPEPVVQGPPSQFLGQFNNAPFVRPVWLYVIKNDGQVLWYRHQDAATGAPSGFLGPKIVRTPPDRRGRSLLNRLNWAQFRDLISAGGANFYARTEAGDLLWYQHVGFNDGTNDWNGPIKVGVGWQNFRKIFSGGDGVVYGIDEKGDLIWYRHAGYATGGGLDTWTGPRNVGSGWEAFTNVFSAGAGVIYAIQPNGDLLWYRHNHYLTGGRVSAAKKPVVQHQWRGPVKVGTGWDTFIAVFSPGDGVIYGVKPDGTLLWYRHRTWNDEVATQSWEGPRQVGNGWSGMRAIVPLMPVSNIEQPR